MRGILIFFPSVLKITENFQTFHCLHFWCDVSDYSTENLLTRENKSRTTPHKRRI